ncbi:hypothetical protein DYB25_008449, partial [Aphanomyces astaci]
VKLKGTHALSLLCRSSIVINTALASSPGTLGGFPGGGGLSQHNMNGPGSSSLRVYSHTIRTSGQLDPTVQEIQTSVALGQTMRGTFTLSDGFRVTGRIPYDASAQDMTAFLEIGLGTGSVRVTRVGHDMAVHGRTWRVTFLTALGNVPLLAPTSYLTGLKSTVQTRLVTVGNQLSGGFYLQFWDKLSTFLPYNITATDMEHALQTSFRGFIHSVTVVKDIPSTY